MCDGPCVDTENVDSSGDGAELPDWSIPFVVVPNNDLLGRVDELEATVRIALGCIMMLSIGLILLSTAVDGRG